MQRIAVVGTSGSGKTTVARRVAEKLGIPHVELDALNWGPDWTEAPKDEFIERVGEAVQVDSWVVDGNYSKVRDVIWSRADTIIWLDYPFYRIFLRLLWRTICRIVLGEELWNGNRERLSMLFSKDSILLWAITSHPRRKKDYPQLMNDPIYKHINFLRHKTPEETKKWINQLEQDTISLNG